MYSEISTPQVRGRFKKYLRTTSIQMDNIINRMSPPAKEARKSMIRSKRGVLFIRLIAVSPFSCYRYMKPTPTEDSSWTTFIVPNLHIYTDISKELSTGDDDLLIESREIGEISGNVSLCEAVE
jgi:hypothetical protein